jgi:hypothetical protein
LGLVSAKALTDKALRQINRFFNNFFIYIKQLVMDLKELKLWSAVVNAQKVFMFAVIVNIFSYSCSVLRHFGRFAGSATCDFSLQ